MIKYLVSVLNSPEYKINDFVDFSSAIRKKITEK